MLDCFCMGFYSHMGLVVNVSNMLVVRHRLWNEHGHKYPEYPDNSPSGPWSLSWKPHTTRVLQAFV